MHFKECWMGFAERVLQGWLIILIASTTTAAVNIDWIRQIGTSGSDTAFSVSTDGTGNAYISGWAEGALGGPHAGSVDAFVAKYDSLGNNIWTRQFGTSAFDGSIAVSADGNGSVYVVGWTEGSLVGANAGSGDVFLTKLDATGNTIWARQFGTTQDDRGMSVATDGQGNVYVSGATLGNLAGSNAGSGDAVLRKYDAMGNVLWTQQFGTALDDCSYGVAADSAGHVYQVGNKNSSIPLSDGSAFVNQYDSNGNLLWTREFGEQGYNGALGVSIDVLGNAYVAGGISAGELSDAFLSKYDVSGNLMWMKQFGTYSADWAQSVSVAATGGIYVTGMTAGVLGDSSAESNDVYVRKYDSEGNVVWTKQFGTPFLDYGYGVAADSLGNVFVAGDTGGSLSGYSAGQTDAFVARISDVPEPTSILLLISCVLFGGTVRRSI